MRRIHASSLLLCLADGGCSRRLPRRPAPLIPTKLGVSRTLVIDAATGPRYASRFGEKYSDLTILADGEVVLTFDDGPSRAYTRPILEALSAQCTKATFFMVGAMAAADPAMVKEVARHGHTIATHTWSHPNLQALTPLKARAEIEMGFSAVQHALGTPISPFFRFPYLRHTPFTLGHVQGRQIASFGIDVDSKDYMTRDAATVRERVLRDLAAKRKGIILFHDIHAVDARDARPAGRAEGARISCRPHDAQGAGRDGGGIRRPGAAGGRAQAPRRRQLAALEAGDDMAIVGPVGGKSGATVAKAPPARARRAPSRKPPDDIGPPRSATHRRRRVTSRRLRPGSPVSGPFHVLLDRWVCQPIGWATRPSHRKYGELQGGRRCDDCSISFLCLRHLRSRLLSAAARQAQEAPKSIKVGYAISLSGFNAPGAGITTLPNYRLWVDDVNKAGGMMLKKYGKKVPIEVTEIDDNSKNEDLPRLTEKLMAVDKVDIVLTPWSTGI